MVPLGALRPVFSVCASAYGARSERVSHCGTQADTLLPNGGICKLTYAAEDDVSAPFSTVGQFGAARTGEEQDA